jgi:hypothetical protein
LTGSGNTFYHYRIIELNSRGNTFFGGSAIYIGPHSDVNSETASLHGGGSEFDGSVIVSENENNHGLHGGLGATATGINTLKNSVVENVYSTDTANLWIPSLHAGSAVYNNLFIGSGFQPITTGLKGSKTVASSAQHDYYSNTFAGLGNGLYWEHGSAGTPQNGTTNYKNNLHFAQQTGTMAMVEGNTGPSADIVDYLDNNAFFAGTSGNDNYHAIAVSNWTEETRGVIAYVSATSFTIAGVDLTTTYTAGKVLSIRLDTKKAWVKCHATTPSTFSGGNTTVTLDATFGALTVALSQVYYQSSLKTLGTDAGAGGSDLPNVDPQFVDATRTVASYTGTTRAALFEELSKNNGFDIAGNPASRSNSWSVSDAIAYIKSGFTPTNMALATAGEGGTYIGAVQPVAAGDPQTITFTPLASTVYGAAPITLAATASSGLPVSYASSNTSVATVSGSTVTIVGVGSTNITATQAGDETYAAATPVIQALTVAKADQTISISAPSYKLPTDPPFEITATASSGLTCTLSILSGPATIENGTVTLTGTLGDVVIRAVQAGNANYNAAADTDRTVRVVDELPVASTRKPLSMSMSLSL